MSDPGIRIVAAEERHLQAITEIYNDAVLNTTSTFDFRPRTTEEQRAWIGKHDAAHPIVVALSGEEVLGWGSISEHNDRCCYRTTVEDSVYVKLGHRGQGIGTLILRRLIQDARAEGHHAVLARIDADNEVSLRLHSSLGFQQVGRLKEVGFKFNRWLDVILMELLLESVVSSTP